MSSGLVAPTDEDDGDGATPPIERFRRMQVNLRYWPGLGGWRSPQKPASTVRLKDRMGFYVVARPETGAVPERLGLGGWLLALGNVVLAAGLFHDDRLGDRGPEVVQELRQWCGENPIDTPLGPLALSCTTLTEFATGAFLRHSYIGRSAVVGADLGRTLGLMADWWAPSRRGEFRGGWSLGLRGWGVIASRDGKSRWSASYGRPWLLVQAVGNHGTRAAFGWPRRNKEGKRRGVWVPNPNGGMSSYRGHFLDVIGAAFAFDGEDSSDLDDHLRLWGIDPVGATHAVSPNADGARMIVKVATAIHRLAMAVDSEAARWV